MSIRIQIVGATLALCAIIVSLTALIKNDRQSTQIAACPEERKCAQDDASGTAG